MGINYNFEWDIKKARSNTEKHGVRFEEAATVFIDPMAVTIYDPDHSETEERSTTMGIWKNGRLLIVCHTFNDTNRETVTLRIFSSRKANSQET
ncbi:MAG: BrnT family toxin [Syntrophorhabdus sp.]